jgi:hypothetical protein
MFLKRMRLWLDETHNPQFELLRHFLFQQQVHDFRASDQLRRLIVTVLAALGFAGPLIVCLYRPKYAYLQGASTPDLYVSSVHADRLFFVSLSMITAGFITAIQWQNLFPSRQDYLILKPMPIRLFQVFLARFMASFGIVAVVVVDLNLLTSIFFPALTSGRWQFPPFGMRYLFAHGIATVSAGLFVFFAMAVVQGACLSLLSPRAFDRFSVSIQAVSVITVLTSVPYVFDMPNWYRMMDAHPYWISFFPPAWFLGFYERMLGTTDVYFLRLSETAVWALAISLVLAFVTYYVSYRGHATRILEQSSQKRSGESSRLAAVVRPFIDKLVKNSNERAVFDFAIHTLRRSRNHKLLVGLAIGIALVLGLQGAGPLLISKLHSGESWRAWQLGSILAVPLVIGAVVVTALCYIFQIPSEVRANWIFRIAEGSGRRELLNAVETVLILCGVVPVILATLPIEALVFGWILAFAHAALAAVLLLLLIEARLYEWHKLPFTCSYMPGRRNFWQIMGIYLFLFGLLIPTITYFEARFLRPFLLLGIAATLTVVYFGLRSPRQAQWKVVPLLFDELDEPLITSTHLNRE